MKCTAYLAVLLVSVALLGARYAGAGQVPGHASDPDIPISHQDRVYAAEQFSNTVSVIDPAGNTLVGAIHLGEPQPANLSPLYKGQLLVHGMGFSPDHRTLVVVAIGSNAVIFIDTATNAVKHITYVAARRTSRSSRRMARRYGSPSAARTMSRCSTARHSRKRRGSLSPTGPG